MEELITYLEQQQINHFLNCTITPYVTMGIGGTVPLLVIVCRDDHLKSVLTQLHTSQIPYILLGGGSNVIFPDTFTDPRFTVIINRTGQIEKVAADQIKVNSGVINNKLMAWNIQNSIGGMDFLAGIPGTVGGAAAVNGGAFGQSISSLLTHAEIFTRDGQIKTVDTSYFQFQYRDSIFKYGKESIINVFLKFYPEDSALVREKVTARQKYRQENHPPINLHSAGCFFKNPIINGQKTSAGKLIEQTGFKGKTFKTLRVAAAHSNFIINDGNASFADILELEKRIKQDVDRTQGITLEREVIYISPSGEKY